MEPAAGTMRRRPLVVLVLGLLMAAGLIPARAEAEEPPRPAWKGSRQEENDARRAKGERGRLILQWDRMEDSNGRELDDYWAFLSFKQAHFQIWSGEYTDGVEIGGYLRDRRRSTYSAFYRFRDDFDHVLQFDSEQVLGKGFVHATMVRGIRIIPDDPGLDRHQVQFGTGFDWYWGDYNFLTFRAISDPREGGRWSFLLGHRFHKNADTYVQPVLIKSTDGSTSWFVQGKIKHFRWQVGEFDRFDFTEIDRKVISIGLEMSY